MNGHLFNEWSSGHFVSKKGFEMNFEDTFKREDISQREMATIIGMLQTLSDKSQL